MKTIFLLITICLSVSIHNCAGQLAKDQDSISIKRIEPITKVLVRDLKPMYSPVIIHPLQGCFCDPAPAIIFDIISPKCLGIALPVNKIAKHDEINFILQNFVY